MKTGRRECRWEEKEEEGGGGRRGKDTEEERRSWEEWNWTRKEERGEGGNEIGTAKERFCKVIETALDRQMDLYLERQR